jgi:hypothetical protein
MSPPTRRRCLRYIKDLLTYLRLIRIFGGAIGEFDGEKGVFGLWTRVF